MLKVRFHANYPDYRPINWPVKHPYWCSGSGGDPELGNEFSVMVAYVSDLEELCANWPEATHIDVFEENVAEYQYSDRFPKPDWLDNPNLGLKPNRLLQVRNHLRKIININ